MGLRQAADSLATESAEMASRESVAELHHRQNLWIPWTVVLLGLWLVTAPFVLGYLHDANWVRPSGGRGVWFSDGTHDRSRAQMMTWSNVASGVALVDLDITSAREHLGWEPEHRVADVVPEMVHRLQADRDDWYRRNDLAPPRRVVP